MSTDKTVDELKIFADDDDMQSDETSAPESQFNYPMVPGYFLSYYVKNVDGDSDHGIITMISDNPATAIGQAYVQLRDQFPSGEGWYPPEVICDNKPVIIADNKIPIALVENLLEKMLSGTE